MPHKLVRVACLSLSSLAALAGTALAQEAPPPAPPATPLFFPTMGPDAQGSNVNLRLGLQQIEDADESIKRFEVGGQFVGTGNAGGYATMAVAMVDEVTAVSNLEVGGLYNLRGRTTDTALRFGLVLPTGSGADEDDFDELFVNAISITMARPSDSVTISPEMTSLRVAAAPTYRSGQIVLRADVGLDVPIDGPGDDTPEPIYHVDLGVGFDGGQFGVTGELTSVGSLDSDAEGTFHVLALSGQYRAGKVSPFATFSLPFDRGVEDGFIEGSYNLFAGVRIGL
jgi:hypothetical protein